MSDVRAEVDRRLDAIEAEHGVRIVYACESGSRAWGFESADSDYDVRFIYLRPRDWYLSIDLERQRDVIETPIEGLWDVNGWDLRKALHLFRKSNPPLAEWLQSPIVYRNVSRIHARVLEVLPDFYSPRAAMFHYLQMARGNSREFLSGDLVRRKKYFYVLRPLLACRWIEADLGVVPIEFGMLVERTLDDASLLAAIDELLEEKRAGMESDRGAAIPPIREFIEAEIARHREAGTRIELVGITALDVSATDLRARVRAGRSLRYLVPEVVRESIEKNGAYGDRAAPVERRVERQK